MSVEKKEVSMSNSPITKALAPELSNRPAAPRDLPTADKTFNHYPLFPQGIPPMVIESGEYRLRFAASKSELDALLKLRFDIYNLEMGEGLDDSYQTQRDVDAYDAQCHHLYVEYKASGECVGTYRLQTAEMAQTGCDFYTDQEFCLEELPGRIREEAVEVGRACIGRAHRNGQVLQLLWKGLANYLVWNGKRYLFGACSLPSQDPAEGMTLYRKLVESGCLHPTLRIDPRRGWSCRVSGSSKEVPVPEIPRLLRGYLSLGATLCGEPALDRSFKTIDFLVLLDIEAMPPGMFRRFLA